jgi:hypothetical protein
MESAIFLLKVLFLVVWPYLMGKAVLICLSGYRNKSVTNYGISIILGTGLLSLLSLILNSVGLPFDLVTLLIFSSLFFSGCFLFSIYIQRKKSDPAVLMKYIIWDQIKSVFRIRLTHAFFLGLIIILVASYYFRYTHLSWAYDSITQWQGRGIVWSFLGNISNSYSYGISRHAPLYAVFLGIEHLVGIPNPGLISAILIFAFILILSTLISFKGYSLFSFLLLSTIPLMPQIGLRLFIGTSEIFVAIFAAGGLVLILREFGSKNPLNHTNWLLSGILWGMFASSRSDNVVYLIFMCMPIYAFLLFRKRWRALIFHLLPILMITISVNYMYRITGSSIIINSLWKSPLVVLPRIARVLFAVIRAQISENYLALTLIFFLLLIWSGFKLGKAMWPILIGLFNFIGLSVVFGIIDSFWETDYLEKWMKALSYIHEGDGGIGRYTIVANIFIFIGIVVLLRKAVLNKNSVRLNKKGVAIAWMLLLITARFGVFKYDEEGQYRIAVGTKLNAILGFRPIATYSISAPKPDKSIEIVKYGPDIKKGNYDIKIYSRQSGGANDPYVNWVISDSTGKAYGLNYPMGFVYTTPNITHDYTSALNIEKGPISILATNLRRDTGIQLNRVEITNNEMSLSARYINWIAVVLVLLALSLKIIEYYNNKGKVSNFLFVILIIFALLPFLFHSAFIYAREISLAGFCRTHSYNESIGLQFGQSMENVLDLLDRHTKEGDKIFFLSDEYTPAMTGPLILFQKYGSSRKVFHKVSLSDDVLINNSQRMADIADFAMLSEALKHKTLDDLLGKYRLINKSARVADLADFVIISEPLKHKALDALLGEYRYWISPLRGKLNVSTDDVVLSEKEGIFFIREQGTKDLLVTGSKAQILVETTAELTPFVSLKLEPHSKCRALEPSLNFSFDPYFETEYWTSPRFYYEITDGNGMVIKDKTIMDIRNQKLKIPKSILISNPDKEIRITFYIERRKSGGTVLTEYLLDVRPYQQARD